MTWRSPEELVTIGFSRAPIVMMNEGHNGEQRCPRTRRVGRAILPAAHAAGCRVLAMEALSNPGRTPFTLDGPPERSGYLGQPEMIDFVDAALALGWKLVAYECNDTFATDELRADPMGNAFSNWREAEQATNVLAAAEQHGRILVWCGNGHHRKHVLGDWIPMGSLVAAQIATFCIDQIVTVSLAEGHMPAYPMTPALGELLDARGGTAGFLVDETPHGMRVIRGYDAALLSTDNAVL